MNPELERAARALATAEERNGFAPWDMREKHAREYLFDCAAAVIHSALMEPSEEVVEAIERAIYHDFCRGQPWEEATEGWKRAMRGAARAALRAAAMKMLGNQG